MRTPTSNTLIVVGAALLALTGCGESEGPAEAPTETTSPAGTTAPTESVSAPASAPNVEIVNFSFMPETVEVEVGTTVSWTNRDDFAHTVTSGEPSSKTDTFDGVLGDLGERNAAGTEFTYTFDEPGTYPYFCRFHPNMTGTIEVSG